MNAKLSNSEVILVLILVLILNELEIFIQKCFLRLKLLTYLSLKYIKNNQNLRFFFKFSCWLSCITYISKAYASQESRAEKQHPHYMIFCVCMYACVYTGTSHFINTKFDSGVRWHTGPSDPLVVGGSSFSLINNKNQHLLFRCQMPSPTPSTLHAFSLLILSTTF